MVKLITKMLTFSKLKKAKKSPSLDLLSFFVIFRDHPHNAVFEYRTSKEISVSLTKRAFYNCQGKSSNSSTVQNSKQIQLHIP